MGKLHTFIRLKCTTQGLKCPVNQHLRLENSAKKTLITLSDSESDSSKLLCFSQVPLNSIMNQRSLFYILYIHLTHFSLSSPSPSPPLATHRDTQHPPCPSALQCRPLQTDCRRQLPGQWPHGKPHQSQPGRDTEDRTVKEIQGSLCRITGSQREASLI